jgi:diguanylate cyclase
MRNTEELNVMNSRRWNRKYLTSFWYALLVAVFTEELSLIIGGKTDWHSQLVYMTLPAAINLVILGIAELMYRRLPQYFHFVILFTSTLICGVLTSFHYELDYIQASWILPIMISIFYFQRRLVLYATVLNIAAFLTVTSLHPGLMERTDSSEWVTMPMMLLVAALITLNAMERGIELLRELRNESEDKQNLMIQNVIKDKIVRTDPLTGLYNRAALNEHLDMLLRYTESEGFSLHVAMLDVDYFKSVNDTYGHQAGDMVLRRMAAAIKESIGNSDFAARYGGEEFTIVFTDRTLEDVRQTLERIRKNVELVEHPELGDRRVTLSIGLYPYSKGMERERLFEQADACLYEAKRTGRNKLCDHL